MRLVGTFCFISGCDRTLRVQSNPGRLKACSLWGMFAIYGVFREIRKDVGGAKSRPSLTELYKRYAIFRPI